MTQRLVISCLTGLIFLVGPVSWAEVSPRPSFLESAQYNLRYSDPGANLFEDKQLAAEDNAESSFSGYSERPGSKSPAKAFLMSLLVPGLGQFYYGSKTKAAAFLAVEAGSWLLSSKYNKKGDEITAEFEAFNRAHWSQAEYERYLSYAYSEYVQSGEIDDDWITETEISHHLPDTRTQQYYEMTGKYNQFSWGWDDANLGGLTLGDYDSNNPPPRLDIAHASSARRLFYEERRHAANIQFDHGKKMIAVAMFNHLVSAFEAYFVTKHKNNEKPSDGNVFGRLGVKPSLKSIYVPSDTPYLKVSYSF